MKIAPEEGFVSRGTFVVLCDINNPLVDSMWCLFVNTGKVNTFCPNRVTDQLLSIKRAIPNTKGKQLQPSKAVNEA